MLVSAMRVWLPGSLVINTCFLFSGLRITIDTVLCKLGKRNYHVPSPLVVFTNAILLRHQPMPTPP